MKEYFVHLIPLKPAQVLCSGENCSASAFHEAAATVELEDGLVIELQVAVRTIIFASQFSFSS